ncbi:tricarboxylate transport membrane protein TctA [Sulfurospirillum multivorans DSM 12446]|uniref:Tricarboxylate transport membrane protein TctA n=3 Tax=Sulfurospirillum multivorans TaxID=66821 RepID=A0AA86AQ29_SULMK|nr:tripartite tricarboxylate transporter permease [Sulfurospirillum multivorans]AHJ13601.1 tricarboxylate transport membrane protein TctA [Sulfurospirillum multivorans DSM 12446]QEH07091.1 tricarboxylate transport membrane protein TctA [Sulfurospirillum multivorans]
MMEVLSSLAAGFAVVLTPTHLFLIFLGCLLGTLFGALPGLGPINGVAILLPICYTLGLPVESSLIMLAGIYYGAEFGGRISSILLNVPGDAGAVFTCLDGYPMAQKGLAGPALALSGVASFIGGTIAIVGLTFFAPLLASVAIYFGPAEYFVLMVFAFATIGALMGSNPVKSLIGVTIGLIIGVVGVDSTTGVLRFTLGEAELYDGFEFLIVIVGFFAVSEIMLMLEHHSSEDFEMPKITRVYVTMKELLYCKWTMVRSSLIGFVVGTLPGTGASIASAVSYTIAQKISDKEGTFGKGDMRGLAAPESANNACAGGALVPMLTLGVPGSGTTAVLLGALMLYNINPGPMLFVEQPKLVWGLIASMYIGNVMLLIINFPMVRIFTKILQVPYWLLVPSVIVLAFVGVYSVNMSTFALLLSLILGVLGYFLRKLHYPMAPVILGFVLGKIMEDNLRRAFAMSGGEIGIFFQGTINYILWGLTLFILFVPMIAKMVSKRYALGKK